MGETVQLDFSKLIFVLAKEKWIICVASIFCTVLGIIYSYYAREEYISQGKIMPEFQAKSSGGLSQFSGLASLAGIDLSSVSGGNVDAIRPDLYPDVINSTPFYLELLKSEVITRENKKMTFEQFYHLYIEGNKEPSEKLLKKYPVKEDGIIILNRLSENRIKDLRSRLVASIDKKSGIISIQSKMPDPVVASYAAKFSMNYLMEYVTEYRVAKLKQDLEYLELQVTKSRGKFHSSQERKAKYSDSFQDIKLQAADIQRERIESEYRLNSNFYNELLKKHEEAKFKLQKETPVFQILEPPVTSVKRAEPKRTIITLISFIIGSGLGLLSAILKDKNYKLIFV